MKVQIKEKSSGKIKTMDRRHAEILVRLKLASFVDGAEAKSATPTKTITKVVEPVQNKAEPSENVAPHLDPEVTATVENTSVATEENISDNEAAATEEKPQKPGKGKRGRPSNKYDTKVMTAKE